MNDINARDSLSSIARAREHGLKAAAEAKIYLEGFMSGLDADCVNRLELGKFKELIIPKLIDQAEMHYVAAVRNVAMMLMEHDRQLSAAGAYAFAETMILEALGIGCS
jgi:hypothetical protein